MTFPHIFAPMTGPIPLSYLDDNFNAIPDIQGNDIKQFGAIGDGVTDDTSAIQAAITASELSGDPLYQSPGIYNVTSDLYLNVPILWRGAGGGSFENSGVFAPKSKLIWSGSAGGTMLHLGGGTDLIAGLGIKDICFDANSIAGKCISGIALARCQLENITCLNYTSIGLLLTALTGAKNVMANDFRNLMCYASAGSTQGIVMVDTASGNCCHNNFTNTTVIHIGANPGIVVKGDNNLFTRTFLYRVSGAGYGVEIGSVLVPGAGGNNYFFHIEAGAGGLHITNQSNANLIIGYDRGNSQPLPVIDSGSSALMIISGVGNYLNLITGVAGISGNDFSSGLQYSYNLNGAVLFGAADTTKVVTFLNDQSDANYQVIATPKWNTKVWITARDIHGFQINVSDVPGGSGGYVDWITIR